MGRDGAGRGNRNRNRKVVGVEKGVIEEDEERFLGRRGMNSSKGSWLNMRSWVRYSRVAIFSFKKKYKI